jgi:hypothetical protein
MTCRKLVETGIIDTWYEVSSSDGVYNVIFKKVNIKDESLLTFSIKGMSKIEDKVMVLETILHDATIDGLERVNFINKNGTFEVTIDILETAE